MYAWGAVAHTLFPLNIATIFLFFIFLFFGVFTTHVFYFVISSVCALCVHDSSEGHKAVMGLVMGLSYAKGRGGGMKCQGVFSSELGKRGKGEGGEGGGISFLWVCRASFSVLFLVWVLWPY